jgi:hypothetical protein
MHPKDLLLATERLDTNTSRKSFDFGQDSRHPLSPNHRLIFDILNIPDSFYNVEMGFDKRKHQRYIRARLKTAFTLEFDMKEGKRYVSLKKDEAILLWRSIQKGAFDFIIQLDHNGLYTLHSSQTEDEQFILTVSRVKCE